MLNAKPLRRMLKLLLVLVLAAAGLVAVASPASAYQTTSFSNAEGTVWGTISWRSSHSYGVTGSIYGYSAGPGYTTEGQYFVGNGRYPCVDTPVRTNYADGIVRTTTDYAYCSTANIHVVKISYFLWNQFWYEKYFDNPLS